MRLPSSLVVAFLCLLLAAPVWAQSTIYVSTGTVGTVLSLNTGTGTTATLLSTPGADYESLAIIPNNDPNNKSGSPAFFVVVCDPTNDTITRVNSAGATDVVYAGTVGKAGTLQKPQCGRVDSANDLIVSSEVAGSGAWSIPGVAAVPFPSATAKFSTPIQLKNTAISAAQVGQGVTQKVGGDLLEVDQAGNQVVRSTIELPASLATGYSFGPFSPTSFINGNLTSPMGIARDNAGLIYVSEHTTNKKGDVQLFDATGAFTGTCVKQTVLGNQQPNFLGVAEDGTLFVATAGPSSGGVWKSTQSGGTCTVTQIASTASPLTGIAVPPIPVSINLSQAGGGTLNYNFESSLYELTSGGACNVTVEKFLVPTPQLTSLAAGVSGVTNLDGTSVTLKGGVDTPYLSDGGFGSKYMLPDSEAGCPTGPYGYLIAANVDQSFYPNPWIIRCDPAGTDTTCVAANLTGIYFIGGFLPRDITSRGTGGATSDFFLANMNLNTGEQGKITLESPLTQVSPPALAGTFSSGSNASVKFKFTPTITDAVAIIAVAQVCQPGAPSVNDPVCGPNGQASVFPINLININSEGSSTTPPPVIKADKNQQYQFSLSLKGYAPGIYSLSIIALSNNGPPVTVIIKIT